MALRQASSRGGDADAFRRPRQISIPGHHDNFIISQFDRSRQVNRVVTTQS